MSRLNKNINCIQLPLGRYSLFRTTARRPCHISVRTAVKSQLYWCPFLVQISLCNTKTISLHRWMYSCRSNSFTLFYSLQDHFCCSPLNSIQLFQIHPAMGTPYSVISPDSVQPLLRVSCSFYSGLSSLSLQGYHLICPTATVTKRTRITPTFFWLSNPALILW